MPEPLDLKQLRAEIDDIDRQIIDLIAQRRQTIYQVAEYKKGHQLPVFSPTANRRFFRRLRTASAPEPRAPSSCSTGF